MTGLCRLHTRFENIDCFFPVLTPLRFKLEINLFCLESISGKDLSHQAASPRPVQGVVKFMESP